MANVRLPPWLMTLPLLAALALTAAAQPQVSDQEALLRRLSGDDPAVVRQAAETLQKSIPKTRDELLAAADAVKSALGKTRDPAAECALRLALGKLAAAGVEDAAEWGFESMSVTHNAKTTREVFDAHVRALEMVPGAAKELMIGNLDVALNFPDAEPKERQRLKEFVTLTAEAMRTRELAVFLDALLTGAEDLFVKIEGPLEARLLACYQNIKVDPPINADAVARWLDKHPGGPIEVDLAALETISLVGTTQEGAAAKLVERLLAKPDIAISIAHRLITGNLDKSLLPQVKGALRSHATKDPNGPAASTLAELEKLPR